MFAPGSYEYWQSWHNAHNANMFDISHGKMHSSSQQERRSSAAAECWICRKLEEKNPDLRQYKGSLFHIIEQSRSNPSVYKIMFYDEEDCEESKLYKGSPRFVHVQRSDTSTDVFDAAVKSRLCTRTSQDDVLQLALEWLKTCQDSHDCLAQSRDAWYPSRLLDVSCGDSVRLVITADERVSGDYVTLSHCWGSEPFLFMTPDNISKFTNGYPVENLSLTFREAITVTKYLDIKYLWIDSYCIMQGDSRIAREDWSREAEQMHKVYTNSCLNIGCAHSDGPRYVPSHIPPAFLETFYAAANFG